MKKIFFLLTIIIFVNQKSIAQDDPFSNFSEDDLKELQKMNTGTVIKQRDFETGLVKEDYNTQMDKARTSFHLLANHDLASVTGLYSLEFIYAHRFESLWWEFVASKTSAKFGEISQRNSELALALDDLESTQEDLISLGMGVGFRNSWIQNLIRYDDIFSTTSAALTYNKFSENFIGRDYSGPGLRADFGIHKRSSTRMHYGFKMSYNLAQVKRAKQVDTEDSASRSLTLSWLSAGLDISFYY